LLCAVGGALGGLLCLGLVGVLVLAGARDSGFQVRKEERPLAVLMVVALLAAAAGSGAGYLLAGEGGMLAGPVLVGAVGGGMLGFAIGASGSEEGDRGGAARRGEAQPGE
jgi:hypothetical protein